MRNGLSNGGLGVAIIKDLAPSYDQDFRLYYSDSGDTAPTSGVDWQEQDLEDPGSGTLAEEYDTFPYSFLPVHTAVSANGVPYIVYSADRFDPILHPLEIRIAYLAQE